MTAGFTYKNGKMTVDNGCPKCEKLAEEYWKRWGTFPDVLCLDCRIEQADADVLKAMNRLEELQKRKERK